MNRVYLSVIAAMAACILFLGWHIDKQNERVGALAEQNKSLTEAVDRAAERETEYRRILGARSKEIASQARKLKQANAALSEALQANKSWSDTDVPPDVQKALQGRSDGPVADPDRVRNPD